MKNKGFSKAFKHPQKLINKAQILAYKREASLAHLNNYESYCRHNYIGTQRTKQRTVQRMLNVLLENEERIFSHNSRLFPFARW